jgi:transcriptional regulator with GAF, ATPase, and Fis domain
MDPTAAIIMEQSEAPRGRDNGADEVFQSEFAGTKLEALTVLAHALLREIETLKQTRNRVHNMNISDEVHRFEAELIRSALNQTGGKLRCAATLLGMKVTTLHSKVKRYKLG